MTDKNSTRQDTDISLAIEEMKILSSIIGRIETAIYQKQGWLFTMITGLLVVLLKDDPLICKEQFAAVSGIATFFFYVTDIIQRVPVYRAINRSKYVEQALQAREGFNSPSVSKSLGNGKDFSDMFKTGLRFRVWAPYALIIGLIITVYSIAP